MGSAQIGGSLRVYIESPSGVRKLVASNDMYWWGPGGSSDGTIANTPEKWNFLPKSNIRGGPGYKIVLSASVGTGATADASDMAMVLPVEINGSQQYVGNSAHAAGIGNDNFTATLAAGDVAYVASREQPILIYTAKEGVNFSVGGGKTFISLENNS